MAANFTSFVTCAVVAVCLLVFWWEKHDGLPYASVLPLMAIWVALCGATRFIDVLSVWYPLPVALTVLDIARAVVGLAVAMLVPFGIRELARFAPPRQMQSTINVLKKCLSDSIRVEEKPSNGAGANTIGNGSVAVLDDGGSARQRSHQPALRICNPGTR